CLGVAGLALSALLVAWLWQSGRALLPTRATDIAHGDPPHSAPHRGDVRAKTASPEIPSLDPRLLLIIISAATAAAALIEQQTATVTSTLGRAAGLAGFMLIAVAAHRVLRSETGARFAMPALAAAAIAAFTHCQIELTGVTPGANLWVFLLMAVG